MAVLSLSLSQVQQSSFYGYTGMLPKRYTQGVMTGESEYLQTPGSCLGWGPSSWDRERAQASSGHGLLGIAWLGALGLPHAGMGGTGLWWAWSLWGVVLFVVRSACRREHRS